MIKGAAILLIAIAFLVSGCSWSSQTETQPSRGKAAKAPSARLADTTTTTARPSASSDPIALGVQIEKAETAIRDDKTTPAAFELAARTQQVAYRLLSTHPEWDSQVSAELPAKYRLIMEANVRAGRELRQLVRKPKDTLPAWEIIPPEPIEVLRAAYEAGESEFGVPWEYLAAVHLTETRMGRIRGISTAGARGPMQFLPSTWDAYGKGDIENTHDAIAAAARYLAANGAPERMADALYRYNPTQHYVTAVTAYAKQMEADERAFQAYYHWQVFYTTTLGDVLLEVGYKSEVPRPVTQADVMSHSP